MTARHHNGNPRPATAPRTGKTGPEERGAPTLVDGKVRCPVCRNVVGRTPNGYLRKHRDLFGHPCFNKAAS